MCINSNDIFADQKDSNYKNKVNWICWEGWVLEEPF